MNREKLVKKMGEASGILDEKRLDDETKMSIWYNRSHGDEKLIEINVMAMEEMAELVACLADRMGNLISRDILGLIEEMADVTVMCAYLKNMHQLRKVTLKQKEMKELDKLAERSSFYRFRPVLEAEFAKSLTEIQKLISKSIRFEPDKGAIAMEIERISYMRRLLMDELFITDEMLNKAINVKLDRLHGVLTELGCYEKEVDEAKID